MVGLGMCNCMGWNHRRFAADADQNLEVRVDPKVHLKQERILDQVVGLRIQVMGRH